MKLNLSKVLGMKPLTTSERKLLEPDKYAFVLKSGRKLMTGEWGINANEEEWTVDGVDDIKEVRPAYEHFGLSKSSDSDEKSKLLYRAVLPFEVD